MNIKELRKELYNLCQDAGSIRAWADERGLAFGYVAAVIRGDVAPGNKILKAMGLRKPFSAKKKPRTVKFESIN